MNRRNFLGTLFGFAVAPSVAARVLSSPPKPKYKVYRDNRGGGLVGYKGSEYFRQGVITAPYIPLMSTDMVRGNMNREMREEIDREILEMLLRNA